MEQGRSEEDRKQQQDLHQRRMRPPPVVQSEGQVPHHPQPQQPQKCPRCESLNTKFCYYNNYSLAQPRYFCKTCRRYWTQGGTLRNVPVGGGCRKGKRAKASSSSSSSSGGDNSRSQPPPPVLPQQELQVPQNLTQQAMMMSTTSQALKNKEMGALVSPSGINPAMNSYYSGGGFLSSFVAMQSMSQPQPFNPQTLSIGGQFGGGGGASNLALLQGFDIHSQQQNEIYQMGNREKSIEPLYPSDQGLIQPSRPVGSNWNQTLFNNTNSSASNSNFWNSTTSTTTNSNTAGTSVNPADQWPDLPGYGPST